MNIYLSSSHSVTETSSVSDYAANQQSVLYQWKAPSLDLLDFVKRSEQFMKQLNGLIGSDESALIEETDRSVTVVGQATDVSTIPSSDFVLSEHTTCLRQASSGYMSL